MNAPALQDDLGNGCRNGIAYIIKNLRHDAHNFFIVQNGTS